VEDGRLSARIEDYALVGDGETAALVSRTGSVDWLCWPRFDSAACFAALLGSPEHGCWRLAPAAPAVGIRRGYVPDTLVLETEIETPDGRVRVVDFMPPRSGISDMVRVVHGLEGRVPMRTELTIRFEYGSVVPWVTQAHGRQTQLHAVAGPDMLTLRTTVPLRGEDAHTVGEFEVGPGDTVAFVMSYGRSHLEPPRPLDVPAALDDTLRFWREWSGKCRYEGQWRQAVVRSLITLKALIYAPTGGIVAAATASLPELVGGTRNWDYRYCWLRDATFTLLALMNAGYFEEADAWRRWLVRALAGAPAQAQIMYGVAGERRLPEWELTWLPGYEQSCPVRIGNAAAGQLQLDVYGEIADALHHAREGGLTPNEQDWAVQRTLTTHLEKIWQEADEGIWEVRGPRQHFTHSKVMAWLAYDRAVHNVEQFDLQGPVDRWRAVRDEIHAQICAEGFDRDLGAFTQSYGSKRLDAAVLMMPMIGFLPGDDERIRGTVQAIERHLMKDGFVARYETTADGAVDGLPAGEGSFLPCSFWLADNLALVGREDDAVALFERLIGLANDVGLLAEEYDGSGDGRQLGNFPQAFTHVSLVNTAAHLSHSTQFPGDATYFTI
jgi:GH15 family glucan-1,4-alpha-glucosidase